MKTRAALTASSIVREFRKLADPARAKLCARYFRTRPGEYAEGDRFLGTPVPVTRRFARAYRDSSLDTITTLLRSPWHEVRQLALILLVSKFERADEAERGAIFRAYLKYSRYVNNWDLVDVSAPHIVGAYLADRDRAILVKLARSRSLWERRIAMVATQRFIRNGEFADAMHVASLLRNDPHDLIHKAVGWMLREIGNRNQAVLEQFLDAHAASMPRTMLRYATERLPQRTRKRYLTA